MRIQGRLDRIERLLRMGTCDLCGPGRPYHVPLVVWPNGFGETPCLMAHGQELPAECPGCGRALSDPRRPVTHLVGIDPNTF